jgi:hypothetical protein
MFAWARIPGGSTSRTVGKSPAGWLSTTVRARDILHHLAMYLKSLSATFAIRRQRTYPMGRKSTARGCVSRYVAYLGRKAGRWNTAAQHRQAAQNPIALGVPSAIAAGQTFLMSDYAMGQCVLHRLFLDLFYCQLTFAAFAFAGARPNPTVDHLWRSVNADSSDMHDYLRMFADEIGERILRDYPALHGAHDPVSPRLATLLRKPFPAQAVAAMGVAKKWQTDCSAAVIAECGTGKTLISLASVHVHSDGRPFTAIVIVTTTIKWLVYASPEWSHRVVARWRRYSAIVLGLPDCLRYRVRIVEIIELRRWRSDDHGKRLP